ncbi:hypothetical protein An08g06125 [Aspergillus niger]|uniref:Uncharacterized protein n=2 Tax=Aspergillus niger TaxID=5061 RepID=A2QRI1_ASPNC|nr:hypothetical protein An08g06125 [Aspergillus niger]CAK45582.1 hypothetical protein An08g06125 [Aspergillus niger]
MLDPLNKYLHKIGIVYQLSACIYTRCLGLDPGSASISAQRIVLSTTVTWHSLPDGGHLRLPSKSEPQLRPQEHDQNSHHPHPEDPRIQHHPSPPALPLRHPPQHPHTLLRNLHIPRRAINPIHRASQHRLLRLQGGVECLR